MSNSIYSALGRQTGLVQELQVVANNLANASTSGYKADRAVFAEYIVSAGAQAPSRSMGGLAGHAFDLEQGGLKPTGGQFDFAVQGEGFFALETDAGQRLTRAGHFQLSADGALVDANGARVLGQGGGPIVIPADASQIAVAGDGTISADGVPFDQVGLVIPIGDMLRDTNAYFMAPEGFEPATDAQLVQGALELSNVSSVLEVARMIEVQRAYEAGQALLEREDQRINQLISAVRNA